MPKPSALSTLSHLMFCGTLVLFIPAPQAAGQTLEPEKDQTENVRPQFNFTTGGPSGLRVERQAPAAVPPLILPSLPNFPKFAQTVPSSGLKSSGPFNVQIGRTAVSIIPKMPLALPPQSPEQQNLCSVPLVQVQPDPSMNFAIRQAPAPPIDRAMVVKPLAPSCDEKKTAQKPGFPMPLPPNLRRP
ncbi:MAG TPA: hypothetical protein VEN79_05230 [Terriglobia bacterium]|nr:hypothetical protein [Terriglobia bacterium]